VARYPLNLPVDLKREAERVAASQGVSLNQLIQWALAEKVGELRSSVDDRGYPSVTYRRGAAGQPVPVIRGTGVRVQALVVASRIWKLAPSELGREYGLSEGQVNDALSFYEAHQREVDALIEAEQAQEPRRG
jgi:uncharacterized protein (DUF433 family)